MKYYIGADLGTSALKLLLVDNNGEIINTVSHSYPLSHPNTGWSEQPPEYWWDSFKIGVKELICNMDPADICGIGVGGQMHGLVVLDKDDNIIRPAILWNDSRTEKEVDYLNEVIGKEKLAQMTANIAFTGFTAPKLIWMMKNEPDNFNRICKVMLPKDYINYLITGVHACDYSDASGSLLLDVKNRCWSEKMLEICGITKKVMPKLYESYEVIGGLLENAAKELGLKAGIPVVAGAGDNAAAAVGSGTVLDGKCNISVGTSGTLFISSRTFANNSNDTIHSFCHADGGYHLLGGIINAASCNKWFCEDILESNDYKKLQADITDDMLGNNHVYFLPYLMGERSPIDDNDARGTFTGLRLDTDRKDMLLAVLEGVAFAIRDNLEIVKKSGIHISVSGLCGGGAKSTLWQKIFCNVLNIDIELPKAEEGPGYGAAMLPMVGAGEFENIKECVNKLVRVKRTLAPDKEIAERYEKQYRKFSKIYPAMKNLFKELAK